VSFSAGAPDLPSNVPFEPIRVSPFWTIQPPWAPLAPSGQVILVQPGAGFGTGYHPTTQLCLQALAFLAQANSQAQAAGPWRMLDFGSGSGILSIAAAKLGAEVDGVEIDSEALANGELNARLNSVSDRIRFSASLRPRQDARYHQITANILRPVLLDYAEDLAMRLLPGGQLTLSGLVSTDVPELSVRYSRLLGGAGPEVYRHGDWRALVFRCK
jgi:ribosomal protein L11 methyltransferase